MIASIKRPIAFNNQSFFATFRLKGIDSEVLSSVESFTEFEYQYRQFHCNYYQYQSIGMDMYISSVQPAMNSYYTRYSILYIFHLPGCIAHQFLLIPSNIIRVINFRSMHAPTWSLLRSQNRAFDSSFDRSNDSCACVRHTVTYSATNIYNNSYVEWVHAALMTLMMGQWKK